MAMHYPGHIALTLMLEPASSVREIQTESNAKIGSSIPKAESMNLGKSIWRIAIYQDVR